MTLIFADASFFIALIDQDDDFHGRAEDFLRTNRALLFTTSAIVLELGAFYSASHLRSGFLLGLAAITRAGIEVVHVSPSLQQRGIELFESRPDKGWSLADCISFVVMKDRGVNEAATTDEHFEQAGFVALFALAGEGWMIVAMDKPPMQLLTTTLWEYPSQDYGRTAHGDKDYVGATPAWIIWQLLSRYTREGDVVLDPMCGSGTTVDVANELGRKPVGFDLAPRPGRADIRQADARHLPQAKESVDFVFIDPPYSTHVDYSDDPRCIGKLEAGEPAGQSGKSANSKIENRKSKIENPYYAAMTEVIGEIHRVLKNRRYMALYVSDSFKKGKPFMPIGFELFALLRQYFKPVDIIAVVRHNRTLKRNHWHTAAVEGNYFLRGFNYLFIMKKEE